MFPNERFPHSKVIKLMKIMSLEYLDILNVSK